MVSEHRYCNLDAASSRQLAQGGKLGQLYKHMINDEEFDVRFDFGQGVTEAGRAGGVGYCAPPQASTRSHCDISSDLVQEIE